MTITIEIDDSAAKDVFQNIALAKGWTEVSDDQARQLYGQEIARQIATLAKQGILIAKRREEEKEIEASLLKVSVS